MSGELLHEDQEFVRTLAAKHQLTEKRVHDRYLELLLTQNEPQKEKFDEQRTGKNGGFPGYYERNGHEKLAMQHRENCKKQLRHELCSTYS